jgi:hypothetical protein
MHLPARMAVPVARTVTLWRERWQAPEEVIRRLASHLRRDGAVILSGGDYDRWDIGVRAGLLGGARVLMTVEEHGGGKQLFRFLVTPHYRGDSIVTLLVLFALAIGAIFETAHIAYVIFGVLTVLFAFRLLGEVTVALAAIERALDQPFDEDPPT